MTFYISLNYIKNTHFITLYYHSVCQFHLNSQNTHWILTVMYQKTKPKKTQKTFSNNQKNSAKNVFYICMAQCRKSPTLKKRTYTTGSPHEKLCLLMSEVSSWLVNWPWQTANFSTPQWNVKINVHYEAMSSQCKRRAVGKALLPKNA